MNKPLFKYLMLFVVSVLVQVLIMGHIQFSRFVNPYFYLLFILLLPIGIPRYLLLFMGFLLGISIDMFSDTLGVHTSATVLIAFIRPFLLSTANLDEQDKAILPTVFNMGLVPFIRYSAIMILIHHLFLFFIEAFSFTGFFQTFFRSFFSSIFTFVFIVISQFLIFRK